MLYVVYCSLSIPQALEQKRLAVEYILLLLVNYHIYIYMVVIIPSIFAGFPVAFTYTYTYIRYNIVVHNMLDTAFHTLPLV